MKYINLKIAAMSITAISLAGCTQEEKLSAGSLTCEHVENPVGIDTPAPRLAWKLPAGMKSQSAYEIDAGVWQSGKVASDQSLGIEWKGPALTTGQRVTWRVRVWDEQGRAHGWSAPATFVMGVMDLADWKAKWIGPHPSTRPDEDFSGCEWLTTPHDQWDEAKLVCTFVLDKPVPANDYAELIAFGLPERNLRVNGKSPANFRASRDGMSLRFINISPLLVVGTNRVEVDVVNYAKSAETNRLFCGKIRLPGGRVIPSTVANWTSPNGAVTSRGAFAALPAAQKIVRRTENASPAFEKTFTVAKKVKTATLFVTGCGFYEASLNGVKIGDKVLDPTPTEFDRHVHYSTYLLDGSLPEGTNTLKLLVGHGWWDVRTDSAWNLIAGRWRDFPRALAQLEIVYQDGTRETVVTDASWRQVASPVLFDCIRSGEVVGPEPTLPAGLAAVEVAAPAGALVAQAVPASKIVRTIEPVEVRKLAEGMWAVKFAENVAGWARITFEGQQPGDVVTIRYDERSYEECQKLTRGFMHCYGFAGSHRACPVGEGFQCDRYICRGGEETYEPRFTYNGYQYLLLSGLKAAPKKIVGCVIRTDYRVIGSFESSDRDLNALMAAAARSYDSNFANGFPTDCPHREKNGWTGDASIASELAQYHCENTAAYESYLRNLRDTQLEDGNLCCISPSGGWGYAWGNGPGWDSALYTIAWNLYAYRDDQRVLRETYDALVKYLDYTATREDPMTALVQHGLGDWIPVSKMPTVEYTSSCYYMQALKIAARLANMYKDEEREGRFTIAAAHVRNSLRHKYRYGDGFWDDGRQTAEAMALAFGLVEPAEKADVLSRLVEAVEKTGRHVDMGLFGTKWVFRELARNGRADLAFEMLLNPTKPSMMEWLQKSDGGTLWEDWGQGYSRNHIMFGDFMAVAYQYLAGIRLPEEEGSTSAVFLPRVRGFKEILLAPQPIDRLSYVTASVDTPYGVVASSWKRENGVVKYVFTVPAGTTATIRLPGKADETVGPGRWER